MLALAEIERCLTASRHHVLRRDRLLGRLPASPLQRSHAFFQRQMATVPAIRTPTATAKGQRRRTTWLRLTRPDTSAAVYWAHVLASAAMTLALVFTSTLAASPSAVSARRCRVCSISR